MRIRNKTEGKSEGWRTNRKYLSYICVYIALLVYWFVQCQLLKVILKAYPLECHSRSVISLKVKYLHLKLYTYTTRLDTIQSRSTRYIQYYHQSITHLGVFHQLSSLMIDSVIHFSCSIKQQLLM